MWTPSDARIAARLKEALVAPLRDVKMKVVPLDSSFNTLSDISEITATVEGTVYVDTERSTRRTCQLRIIDKDGEYTPKGSSYTTYGNGSLFYWDKYFKIYYLIKVDDSYVEIPVGVFMVDRFEVIAQNGAAVINVDGSDLWKKLTFSFFETSSGWTTGTSFNTVITNIISAAGITRYSLDSLSTRSSSVALDGPLPYEIGVNRGEFLKTQLDKWQIDGYMDVDGYFVTKDRTQPPYNLQGSPVFSFTGGSSAVMLGITKSKSGDSIKNHIILAGEYNNKPAIRFEYVEGIGTNVFTDSSGTAVSETTGIVTTASVTSNVTSDTLTYTSHGLTDGMSVSFTNLGTTTGISTNTNYYVISSTANTFQISDTVGGSAKDLTGSNSTLTIVKNPTLNTNIAYAKYYSGTNSNAAAEISGSLTTFGKRTLVSKVATLNRDVLKAKLYALASENLVVEEEIRLPSVVIPTFEGYDIISIKETNSDTNDKFSLRAFDIPMRSSRQELIVKKSRTA